MANMVFVKKLANPSALPDWKRALSQRFPSKRKNVTKKWNGHTAKNSPHALGEGPFFVQVTREKTGVDQRRFSFLKNRFYDAKPPRQY